MKPNSILLGAAFLVILLLSYFLFEKKSDLSDLGSKAEAIQSTVDSLESRYNNTYEENQQLREENDSLYTVIVNMERGRKIVQEIMANSEEGKIQDLIFNLHKGWQEFATGHDPNSVLVYFMDEFTTNEVKVDVENIPHVRRHNTSNYREHLEALSELEGFEIDWGIVKFYNVFVRNDIFATHYLTELQIRYNGEVVHQSNLLALISGEKVDNEWKIGNYSWIRFESFDILKEAMANSK